MQFLESIKILDGKVYLADLHLQRVNKTLQAHFSNCKIWEKLPINIPENAKKGLYKCRIIYDNKDASVEFIKYERQVKNTFKFIEAPEIIYDFKYANRDNLNKYKKKIAPDCEIIFTKNNFITDAIYSNVCLWNGAEWHTPAKSMLEGVMREKLIANKKIIEKQISVADVNKYSKISFVNALNELGEVELRLARKDAKV